MKIRVFLPVLVAVAMSPTSSFAGSKTDPHPASPEQGAPPPATQSPSQASERADETMSQPEPRPLPGKDPTPGPPPKPPIVKAPRPVPQTP